MRMTYTHYSAQFMYRQNRVEKTREQYPVGSRIELLSMGNDDPKPIPNGTRGIIKSVDDMANIIVIWDSGRQLGVIPGIDQFRLLTDDECRAERRA